METIMNKKLKIVTAISLAVTVIFIAAACSLDNQDTEVVGENPYKGSTFTVSNQSLMVQNRYATRVSQMFKPYTQATYYDSTNNVYASMLTFNDNYDPNDVNSIPYDNLPVYGPEEITNGILNFTIPDPELDPDLFSHLLDWNGFYTGTAGLFCSPAVQDVFDDNGNGDTDEIINIPYWNNILVTPGNIKFSRLFVYMDYSDDNWSLIERQGISGTKTAIYGNVITYIYASADCKITGTKRSGAVPGIWYFTTISDLDLNLKKGWNLLLAKESYGTSQTQSGHGYYELSINNPIINSDSIKWTAQRREP